MSQSLLAPGAILVLWTIIMLIWMGYTRFPAIKRTGLNLKQAPPGGRGQDLEGLLPPQINWKSHNYTHLHEQPTLFYAVIIFLHLSGGTNALTLTLAWAYVALRIIHSLWQSLVNRVPIRLALFSAATICLLILTILAIIATLG
jgi:hypothetical protein